MNDPESKSITTKSFVNYELEFSRFCIWIFTQPKWFGLWSTSQESFRALYSKNPRIRTYNFASQPD